ncbi:MAG: hypothetical protein HOH58_11170 [Opitutaceae bacterium]|jgi:hypothetical protein|nr:hypothetical protein [Opitutaceae bacterium]
MRSPLLLRFPALLAIILSIISGVSARELLRESFDSTELPFLFTEGKGDWKIVDGSLRGQQLAADNHTAFRKIYLDHQNVRYVYDMKLEGDAFHQLLINWGLAHIAKVVIRYDEASVWKIKEANKRKQMTELGHDHGRDPLHGQWNESTKALHSVPINLSPNKWYRVVIEMKDDQLSVRIDGQTASGAHIGITEKKNNFGFQAGGLAGQVSIDNIEVIDLNH